MPDLDHSPVPAPHGYPWRIFAVIGLATTVVLSVIGYSFNTGHHMTAKYTPLISAAKEIRLQATLAHLWLEEIVSGDNSESFDGVIQHIDNALWYATAMLQGGDHHSAPILPLTDPEMRREISGVIAQLAIFRQITEQRYASIQTAGPGSAIDIEFDKTFFRFFEDAQRVEVQLQALIQEELQQFEMLQFSLIAGCLLLSAVILLVFHRYERQRAEHLGMIYAANQQLDRLSLTDGLTGIANRRYFDKYLEKEWKRALREQTPLTLAMIDVDFFKRYNDHYGHLAGDTCLKQLAETLQSQCHRPADLVARYGGEEFAVILPNTSQAESYINGIRKAVMALGLPHELSRVAEVVTLSIGCCTLVPQQDLSSNDLLRRADEALYRAKECGRNRVENSDDLPIPSPPTAQQGALSGA